VEGRNPGRLCLRKYKLYVFEILKFLNNNLKSYKMYKQLKNYMGIGLLILGLLSINGCSKSNDSEEDTPTVPVELKTFKETVNGVSFEMVAVKGGSFMMGSNDGSIYEHPVHRVTVSDFYMGQTEVTQALWTAVMGNNPSFFTGDKLPVETVSWYDVQDFIKELNRLTRKKYRLPTEAEWEYAAGGGSTNRTKWAGTDVETSVTNYAWYGSYIGDQMHKVATKYPNSLGLYDMSGNVWEWCNDWFGDYSANDQVNPTGPSSGSYRVKRGGSLDNSLSVCRVAGRGGFEPDFRYSNLGFRLSLVP
jgi:formylglycine-generating enzyme required for sulfatase activity